MPLHYREELEIVTADGITTGTAIFDYDTETTRDGEEVQSLRFQGLRMGGLTLDLDAVQQLLGADHGKIIADWEEGETERLQCELDEALA